VSDWTKDELEDIAKSGLKAPAPQLAAEVLRLMDEGGLVSGNAHLHLLDERDDAMRAGKALERTAKRARDLLEYHRKTICSCNPHDDTHTCKVCAFLDGKDEIEAAVGGDLIAVEDVTDEQLEAQIEARENTLASLAANDESGELLHSILKSEVVYLQGRLQKRIRGDEWQEDPLCEWTGDGDPPGSNAALDAGCRCPPLENGHGRGHPTKTNPSGWMVNTNCPVHKNMSHFPSMKRSARLNEDGTCTWEDDKEIS